MSSDNGVPPHKMTLSINEVHGSTLSLAETSGPTEQLSHDPLGIRPSCQTMPMVSVGGYHVIIRVKRRETSHGNRFFSNVKVKKPRYFGESVHFR